MMSNLLPFRLRFDNIQYKKESVSMCIIILNVANIRKINDEKSWVFSIGTSRNDVTC